MHRNSGSIADLRSTSTESDINSADESSRAGMSPLQENMGPNFRLPKKKVRYQSIDSLFVIELVSCA